MFPGFYITSAEETMLGGNQLKKDSNRLVWSVASSENNKVPNEPTEQKNKAVPAVVLQPMQIRSYIITLVPL